MKEMQQYLAVLRQLKDFDENLSREIAAKAYQEQERIRLEVRISLHAIAKRFGKRQPCVRLSNHNFLQCILWYQIS